MSLCSVSVDAARGLLNAKRSMLCHGDAADAAETPPFCCRCRRCRSCRPCRPHRRARRTRRRRRSSPVTRQRYASVLHVPVPSALTSVSRLHVLPSTPAATPIPAAMPVCVCARDHQHSTPGPHRRSCSPRARRAHARLVRNRGSGEGRPWVPHSVEYDDLSTPPTSIRQRYVSDHGP